MIPVALSRRATLLHHRHANDLVMGECRLLADHRGRSVFAEGVQARRMTIPNLTRVFASMMVATPPKVVARFYEIALSSRHNSDRLRALI